MRKFQIGYLLRELATILGALIAGGVTWSFCAALLPKPIAGILAVISCIVVGKKYISFAGGTYYLIRQRNAGKRI